MRKKFTPLAFILATVVAPCNAQTESALDSMQHLQEVTISTTRIPELKSNAAATVTIIDNKQIEAMSKIAPDMSHLLGLLTPGMALSSNTTSSRAQSLRGRSALILIDGIPQSTPLRSTDRDIRTIDVSAIDHIEIVKGAASALYGSNAAGGVINIITKKKPNPCALNLNMRFGRHNEQRYGLSWQYARGKWNNLLTVNRNSSDNFNVHNGANPITRVVSTIYGDAVWNFKEQLTFRLNEKLRLTGRAGYFYRQLVRTSEVPERYRDFSGGLRGTWTPDLVNSVDFSYAFDQYDKSDYQRITRLDIRDYSNVQNSLRLLYNHTFEGENVLSVGADYMHDYLFNTNLEGRIRKQDSFDAFAQYDWNISPKWEVVGALRYDYFSDGRISRLTPKVSARYQPVHNLNVRFSYGMGFRAPTLKEKYYNFDMSGIWIVEGNPSLKPEVSQNFNASVDYTKGRYNFTVSAYCNKIENKIATGAPYYKNPSDIIPRLPYLNLDNYMVSGGEATAQARWTNGLTARLSYAYTNERLPKDKNSNSVNNQYIPARKHSMTGHIDWDHQWLKNYGTNIGLDGRFLSAVDNEEFVDYYDISKGIKTIHYPAYALFKLSLVQRIGKGVKVSVILDNIFNYKPEYYYLNCPLTDGTNLMIGMSVDVDKLF